MPLLVPTSAGSNLPGWIRAVADTVNGLVRKRLVETTITAATTLTDDYDVYLCDATDAAFTVTLPKAGLYSGKLYYLKKIDSSANAITIDADGSETIDGAATQSIDNQYQTITLFSDGTGWNMVPISPTLGTVSVTNGVTFNTSGGAAAGTTFDGSAAVTVDYSTVGAQVAGTYLTGNQPITLSGDVTGSGTTAIATTLDATAVATAIGNALVAGTNITITDNGDGTFTVASTGASGGAWSLIHTENISTATANIDVNVSGYTDIMVLIRNVTMSASDRRAVLLSTDGGATFRQTSGDYVFITTSFAETAVSFAHGTFASAAALSVDVTIFAINVSGAPKLCVSSAAASSPRYFVQSMSPVNAIRISGVASANMTGGSVYVLGR